MGAAGSKKTKQRIVFLGLDGSGKSVLIRRLANISDYANVAPNNSIIIYDMKYKGIPLNIWDNPGDIKFRNLSCHQLKDPSAVCYVVDASDERRYVESFTELNKLAENLALKNVPFLIIATKKDLNPQLSLDDFRAKFTTNHSPSLTDYVFISSIIDSSMNQVLDALYGLIMGIRKIHGKQEKTRPASQVPKPVDREAISSPTKSVKDVPMSPSKIKDDTHEINFTDIIEENLNPEHKDTEKIKISQTENVEKSADRKDSETGEDKVESSADRIDSETGEDKVEKSEDGKDFETGEDKVEKSEDRKDSETREDKVEMSEDGKDSEAGEDKVEKSEDGEESGKEEKVETGEAEVVKESQDEKDSETGEAENVISEDMGILQNVETEKNEKSKDNKIDETDDAEMVETTKEKPETVETEKTVSEDGVDKIPSTN